MSKIQTKLQQREKRQARIRAKVHGRGERPRLSVFRSNTGLFLQLIDDQAGKTLVSARSSEIKSAKGAKAKEGGKVSVGFELGKLLAEKAVKAGVKKVVFDRGGYK